MNIQSTKAGYTKYAAMANGTAFHSIELVFPPKNRGVARLVRERHMVGPRARFALFDGYKYFF